MSAASIGTLAPPAAAGSARHLAWLFAPQASRDALAALLSIEAEILEGARPAADHGVAHARLGWWLEESLRVARGESRHPLAHRLLAHCAALQLSPPNLRGLVEVAELDLASAAFESAPDYAEYLAKWSRSLFRNLVLLLAPASASRAAVERFADLAGPAIRDIELGARLASDAQRGRVHAADAAEAYAAWQQQPWPQEQASQLAERLQRRSEGLRRAASTLPATLRPALRPAIAWCALAERLAGHCVATLPLQYHAGRFAAPAATWTAWRAAVAAVRGRLPRALEETR